MSTEKKIVPIFVGGGTRLPAHIGIFKALDELNVGYDHIVGVSGGSIIAALYSTGRTLDEVYEITMETDFNQFRKFSLWSLLRNGGLSDGSHFENWMDEKLGGVTFRELDRDLHVLATDVKGGGPVIFNRTTTPDEKVSAAVRYSMSIPLVFSFKEYKDKLMVDGCILSEDALHKDWAEDGTPVISFRLKSEYDDHDIDVKTWFPLVRYVLLLIRTFMTALSREYINAEFWHSTVVINTGKASGVDFKMSKDEKNTLCQTAYETVKEVLPFKFAALEKKNR